MTIPGINTRIEALINERASDYPSRYPLPARRYAAIVWLTSERTGAELSHLAHLSQDLVVQLSPTEATADFFLLRQDLRDVARNAELMVDFGPL